jgi:phage antirepressor YoqD-like protein
MILGGINNIDGRKYTMHEVARILDCGLGRNKLIDFLKKKGIINAYKMPAQKYLDKGLIAYENKIIERTAKGYHNRQVYLSIEGIQWLRALIEDDKKVASL